MGGSVRIWLVGTVIALAGCGGAGPGQSGTGTEGPDFEGAADAVRAVLQDPPEGLNIEDEVQNTLAGFADEMGNGLRYKKSAGGFELRSSGPDGQAGTPDDVVRQFTK